MSDDPLIYSSRDVARMLTELRGELTEAEQEVRALTARLDAAHAVIRKAQDLIHVEPLTPAEAAEIRAATADTTPQTDTDDG